MVRPAYELADIFRLYGLDYRRAHSLSLEQLRVLRAIEVCRTDVLGGHAEKCGHCDYTRISYNSCRNRHCPKCQNTEREKWLESRREELLPVEYFHVVFTLPEQLARIAFYNKERVYGILFEAAPETLLTIARDPKHLGAGIGFFGILHTWGQNLLHHPHVHFVVPGGGIGPDLEWVRSRPGFFLPVRVLSRLFRRLFLKALRKAYRRNQLRFFGDLEPLRQPAAFCAYLQPAEKSEWVVYAKPPFGGPEKVLDYLGRYTHRVALSNDRILNIADGEVSFQWRDYRNKEKYKSRVMTIPADEFIRRFLIHTLPSGFRRIRHFGFLANRFRREKLELCRKLLSSPVTELLPTPAQCRETVAALSAQPADRCPKCHCGVLMRIALPAYRWPARPPDSSWERIPVALQTALPRPHSGAAVCQAGCDAVATRQKTSFPSVSAPLIVPAKTPNAPRQCLRSHDCGTVAAFNPHNRALPCGFVHRPVSSPGGLARGLLSRGIFPRPADQTFFSHKNL